MNWRSQAHVKWECKYHVVIVPKYRSKKTFGRVRGEIGEILKQLCHQKGVELVEGSFAAGYSTILPAVARLGLVAVWPGKYQSLPASQVICCYGG